MRLKIGLVGEWLRGTGDEGIRNFGQNLAEQYGREHQVGEFAVSSDLSTNRLFLSSELRSALGRFDPDVLFYISPSCANSAALFRSRILKLYTPKARVFVVALQPAKRGGIERWLLPLLVPDGIFVQSPTSSEALRGASCPVRFLPSGVETGRFMPAAHDQKKEIRRRYRIDEQALVVLHVGHINRNRNIHFLRYVARLDGVSAVMVGSSSTPQEQGLVHELAQSGVRVIRDYLPHIEEAYQLADVYLFPVTSEDASIGVPLSVLEAMACNLPVLTTRFGGLPMMFQQGGGFYYFESEDDLPQLIEMVRERPTCSTRKMVEPYSWKNVAQMMLDKAVRQ